MGSKETDSNNDLVGRYVAGFIVFLYPVTFVFLLFWKFLVFFPSGKVATGFSQLNEALIVLLAGGIGSSVYAIRAYLIHSCDLKDFKREYIPWYIFRSILGALLALIFYFVLKGGILILTFTSKQASTEFNVWALTGFSTLVGLFSKYAIEKLRQIFEATFTTNSDNEEYKEISKKKK